jgi:hypothetical protein
MAVVIEKLDDVLAYRDVIAAEDVRRAFDYMLERTKSLEGFECRPRNHGYMSRTLHYMVKGKPRFSFFVSPRRITFYFQRPGITNPALTIEELKRDFPHANALKGGDLNVAIENVQHAQRAMDLAFGARDDSKRSAAVDPGRDMRGAAPTGLLSHRFGEALQFAFELHSSQLRKGTGIPYFSHLMAVSGLVMEHGGDEDEAIAALLHDAVEDQGGLQTLNEISRRFGVRAADLVRELSDFLDDMTGVTPTIQKAPWHQRKAAYLSALEGASHSVLRISAADKLHNLRSLVSDLRVFGAEVWGRFNAPKQDQLYFYRRFHAVVARAMDDGSLADLIACSLAELEDLARSIPD